MGWRFLGQGPLECPCFVPCLDGSAGPIALSPSPSRSLSGCRGFSRGLPCWGGDVALYKRGFLWQSAPLRSLWTPFHRCRNSHTVSHPTARTGGTETSSRNLHHRFVVPDPFPVLSCPVLVYLQIDLSAYLRWSAWPCLRLALQLVAFIDLLRRLLACSQRHAGPVDSASSRLIHQVYRCLSRLIPRLSVSQFGPPRPILACASYTLLGGALPCATCYPPPLFLFCPSLPT
ncbi:hypothetical protein LX36DRAFT_180941 [Colletotrichum falcatum]|nr:hypothetical protein LX36DRAFT_180941 [Colletotrichum falcatum]